MGITQSYLAEKLSITKQSVAYKLTKAEMKPSEIESLGRILPYGFFNEFYENNPNLRQPFYTDTVSEPQRLYSKTITTNEKGIELLIKIDPLEFNPEHARILGTSLKNALEEFQRKVSDK
jgi:hypothetical protein